MKGLLAFFYSGLSMKLGIGYVHSMLDETGCLCFPASRSGLDFLDEDNGNFSK